MSNTVSGPNFCAMFLMAWMFPKPAFNKHPSMGVELSDFVAATTTLESPANEVLVENSVSKKMLL
jgi:hypothetical protein